MGFGDPGGGSGDDKDVEGEAFTQGPKQTLMTQLVQKKKRPAAAEAPPAKTAAPGPEPPKAKKRLHFLTPKKATPVPKKKKKKTTLKTMTTPSTEWKELPDPCLHKL